MCGYDSHQALHTSKCWNGLLHNDKPEKRGCTTASRLETVLLLLCVYDELVCKGTVLLFLLFSFSWAGFRLHALLSTRVHVARASVGREATLLHTVADDAEPSESVSVSFTACFGSVISCRMPSSLDVKNMLHLTIAAVSRYESCAQRKEEYVSYFSTQRYSVHSPYTFSHFCNRATRIAKQKCPFSIGIYILMQRSLWFPLASNVKSTRTHASQPRVQQRPSFLPYEPLCQAQCALDSWTSPRRLRAPLCSQHVDVSWSSRNILLHKSSAFLHFPHIQLCPIGEEWWLQKNSLQQWKWKYVFKNIVNILSKYLFIHAAVTNLCTGFPALLEDGKGSELNQAVFSAPPLSVILLLSPSSF